jgi:hypothetical protein
VTVTGPVGTSAGELADAARLAELRASAKGWHGVQLAVLGFIGLCGALQGMADDGAPGWLQNLAAALVLLALVLACTATALVASAAWPVYGWGDAPSSSSDLRHTGARLRSGIVLTFVAVAVLALATSSSWWPRDATAEAFVEVSTQGGTVCGRLVESEPGTVVVEAGGQRVTLPLQQVVSLQPVTDCQG